MTSRLSPLAGQPAPRSALVDIPRLVTAYFALRPDPAEPAQRVAFGTSGHRGNAFQSSFNEHHVLAITQALCDWRRAAGVGGPLFLGIDTHALSEPAAASALEVFAANGVDVMLAAGDEYTPTPAVSRAIIVHNRDPGAARADGVVITPSHNPPDNGGFKYNPTHGGPAGDDITRPVQDAANAYLERGLEGMKRMPYARALGASTTHRHDYLTAYVDDLAGVLDTDVLRGTTLRLGVDPLGGAGVHYWPRIAERCGFALDVVNDEVDPTFRFMTLDWDGRIRMDPSSPHAMQRLLALKDRYDIAFACDTDHDRHGVVTRGAGLLPPNDYLSVCVDYLFRHRPGWRADAGVGKTVVSTRMIDRVAERLGRRLLEVPVGFKWFAPGLADGSLGFGGEESAGASFLRRDGTAWTTDKDGLVLALLAVEMTARDGRDPGERYGALAEAFGRPVADRIDAPADTQQKKRLAALKPAQVAAHELAGEPVLEVIANAPGNGGAIGGLRVGTKSGWFAARPSGTEALYKIYAESFAGPEHLKRLLEEAQRLVDGAIAG
jgi:phosphoglucomutase